MGSKHQQTEGYSYEEIEEISKFLISKTKHRPTVGIICGSGLGGFTDILSDKSIINYENIPNFPVSTVVGHSGSLVFGVLKGVTMVCMKGRIHPYEGYPIAKCAMPVRVMKLLGVKTLIVTNAAGGVNKSFNLADIMIIKDHVNLTAFSGNSPLKGKNDERWGTRFPAMNDAYDKGLISLMKSCAQELKLGSIMKEGVYVMVGGPAFETIAEIKFMASIGDAVGMSTAHEVTVGHHCGLKMVGLSLITNKCVCDYDTKDKPNHEEVLETGKKRAKDFEKLIEKFVEKLSKVK